MSAEFTTSHGDKIKVVFETMKDFGTECVVGFKQDAIEIVSRDMARVADVRFVTNTGKISMTGGTYAYDASAWGAPALWRAVRTKVASTMFKRFNIGDTMTVGADPKTGSFYVTFANSDSGKTFRTEMLCIDVDAAYMSSISCLQRDSMPPNFTYGLAITMNSNLFASIIGDLTITGSKTITIFCDGKEFRMSSGMLFMKSSISLPCTAYNKEAQAPFNMTYSLKHLQWVAKAKCLSTDITIRMSNQLPLNVEYDSPLGVLSYILSDRLVEDDDD